MCKLPKVYCTALGQSARSVYRGRQPWRVWQRSAKRRIAVMLWALLPLAAWAVGTRAAQGQAAPPPAASPPQTTPPAAPSAAPAPPEPEFAFGSAADLGAGESANAAAPYMIGDFFVGGGQISVFKETSTGLVLTTVGQIPSAGGTQRVKICEDNSPIPVDRVFFDYNHFENAILSSGPQPRSLDADRYTPGFEKTFWDGMASVQLRVPAAHTQNADVFLDGTDPLDNEFGNMDVTLKFLLYRSDDFALAVGSAVNLPTAEGTRIFTTDNTAPTFTIADNAYHILPYVGGLWTPDRPLVRPSLPAIRRGRQRQSDLAAGLRRSWLAAGSNAPLPGPKRWLLALSDPSGQLGHRRGASVVEFHLY